MLDAAVVRAKMRAIDMFLSQHSTLGRCGNAGAHRNGKGQCVRKARIPQCLGRCRSPVGSVKEQLSDSITDPFENKPVEITPGPLQFASVQHGGAKGPM